MEHQQRSLLLSLEASQFQEKFSKLWRDVCRRDMPRAQANIVRITSTKLILCKKLALMCQREVRRRAQRSLVAAKQASIRAKKIGREILPLIRKVEKTTAAVPDRVERADVVRKRNAREEAELRRQEEERLEAKRQQRKLNFLLTQTELYAHFMAHKAAPESAPTAPGWHPTRIAEDDEDLDNELQGKAFQNSRSAYEAHRHRVDTFDAEAARRRAAATIIIPNQARPVPAPAPEELHVPGSSLLQPSTMPSETVVSQPKMFGGVLKDYQLKGLNWLANLYQQGINGILADEMGLGKTVQTIALLCHLAEHRNIWGPFVIVAPFSTLHNWQQEISTFAPDFRTVPYWGTAPDRRVLRRCWNDKNLGNRDSPFHVVITSYQLVVSDQAYFQRVKWEYMALDEAQSIKSSASQRWKTLLGFQCRNRLLLTGTPVQNSMAELWALLHFIMPTLFDSHDEFNEWFSKDIESHAEGGAGALNEHQLKRLHMILKPFMLRRVKRDVVNELGEKVEIMVECELSYRQKLLYRAIKNKLSLGELLRTSETVDEQLMNIVMQLRKVCNHPDLFEPRQVESPFLFDDVVLFPRPAQPQLTPTHVTAPVHLTEPVYLPYSLRNPVGICLPRLLIDDGIPCLPQELSGTQDSVRTQLLTNTFAVFSPRSAWTGVKRSQLTPPISPSSMELEYCSSLAAARLCGASGADLAARASPSSENTVISQWQSLCEDRTHLIAALGHHPCGSHTVRPLEPETPTETSERLDGPQDTEDDPSALPAAVINRLRFCHTPHTAPTCPAALASPLSVLTGNGSDLGSACSFRSDLVTSALDLLDRNRSLIRRLSQIVVPRAAAPAPHIEASTRRLRLDRIAPGAASLTPLLRETLLQRPGGLLTPVYDGLGGASHIHVSGFERVIADSGKLQALDHLLIKLKAEGHRVLLYSQMTRMMDILSEYLTFRRLSHVRLDGSTKIEERRDKVKDFQANPDIFCFLLSTRAGGLGINLTAADTVIFFDSDWNPTMDAQAMDRAHRLGQTRQVSVYRLIAKDTVEERVLMRAKQKDTIQNIVISGSRSVKPDAARPAETRSLLLDDAEVESRCLDFPFFFDG
eukprot:TRINITY_DN2311_c0_g1_i1.p1 TRINITY_DN2311_c0_g1~~TRINITY_DN2311_c0_g1_i1.p1  ORF type:complete len:1094 (-),score=195.74 TRINITY_DN2311_c0_g1_i1:317-3598(-)